MRYAVAADLSDDVFGRVEPLQPTGSTNLRGLPTTAENHKKVMSACHASVMCCAQM